MQVEALKEALKTEQAEKARLNMARENLELNLESMRANLQQLSRELAYHRSAPDEPTQDQQQQQQQQGSKEVSLFPCACKRHSNMVPQNSCYTHGSGAQLCTSLPEISEAIKLTMIEGSTNMCYVCSTAQSELHFVDPAIISGL